MYSVNVTLKCLKRILFMCDGGLQNSTLLHKHIQKSLQTFIPSTHRLKIKYDGRSKY